ncbi:PREDICTED: uncharacterized protein LOC107338600 [Acropora digitifera]|uniref:uncharacterized protein LOC107338600 n=1 Tax=Acropora digitifera TaxID=70779 RepID=UPI00077A8925|nr:PREDICTED: uncharacterized protein LOC107338600 [Acropora digitifera]
MARDIKARWNAVVLVGAVRNFLDVFSTGAVGYTVYKITGGKRGSQNVSSILVPRAINQYFKEINTDPAYSIPPRNPIPPGARIPALEERTVERFLAEHKRTATGPDGLPYWMERDFCHPLAPVITKLFNRSLQEQFVLRHWKLANVTPIPKESPLTSCNQLRPSSLTNIITRLSEKLIIKFEPFDVLKALIGPDQFATIAQWRL